ncbi:hypothetical protein ACO0LF_27200 [Undibacterium sp. Di27W]|uniref:hypothetical protein n=1 Tax=Undibacterium sp. Di27W TaxID=3413036 RepID=UPI003BF2A7D9
MKKMQFSDCCTGMLVLALSCASWCGPVHASEINADGHALEKLLDQTRVTELWPAGVHVNWESGEPDGRIVKGNGKHTHCSAFVAATAKRAGIYLLRPPEHGQDFLANAQYDWLSGQGAAQGWRELSSAAQAQDRANHGEVVVVSYRNHSDNKPGHIAIVRPSEKSDDEIKTEGPQIIQAGGSNYSSTSLKTGFAGHPLAWKKQEVRYFAHVVEWGRLGGNPSGNAK